MNRPPAPRGLGVWVASLAAVIMVTAPARADAPAAALARWLPDLRAVTDDAGRVPVLVALPRGRSAAELGLVGITEGFAAGNLQPDAVFALEAGFPGVRAVTGPRKQLHLDRATGESTATVAFRKQTGLTGKGVVVGIVDTGIDVSHPTFRDPATGKTRIAWLLSGGAPRGVHAELEERAGCLAELGPCAVWSAEDIDAALASDDAIPPDLRDASGHGTHVSGIAAGNGRWPAVGDQPEEEPKFVGMAPGATLIVAAPSSSGGFSDPDILAGAVFAFERAEAMGMPAVVNLSLGGDFGPHDGTSLLEKALATLVGDDRPGRALVVSSGNSAGRVALSGELAGIHTEARVRPHASMRVPMVMAAPSGGSAYVWITMRPGDEVSVGVEGPDGETWIGPIDPGDEAGFEEGTSSAVVINDLVNGKSDLTEDTTGAVVVIQGEFKSTGEEVAILLEGNGDAQLWSTPSEGIALFRRGLIEGTVSVPATHPRIVAVGSSISKARWATIEGDLLSAGAVEIEDQDGVSHFSGCGPTATGVAKPDLVAPGQFIASAMSFDADPRLSAGGIFSSSCPESSKACLLVTEGYGVSAGTSMSSPLVAGAIALLFERDPTLTQGRALEILQAGSKAYAGPVLAEGQKGPGALDMVGALAALAVEDAGAGLPPDPAASYWTLSTSYARPDPTWPVHGIVQLRRTDGTVASGLDGSLLELEVEGGLIQRGITKVRHGMFTFTVSGRSGTEGGEVRVRVLHDGVPLGETQVLQVGSDAFSASDAPQAIGGCSCEAPGAAGGTTGSGRLVLGLTLAASLLADRQRRRRRPA